MYRNLGGKLKKLAIALLILEALCAVIGGITIIKSAPRTGLLLLIGGPILAYVFSWVLYGLGEAVEQASEAAYNTREMLEILQKRNEKESQAASRSRTTGDSSMSIVCKCGERFYGDVCPICGRKRTEL